MARTKWDELLPSSVTSGLSRNDMVQQLARATSARPSSESLNSANGSSAPANVVSSLMQGPARDFTEQISSLTTQMSNLASTQQTQVGVTQDNTQALTQNTASKSSGGAVGSVVGSIASTVLGSGSILSPMVSGLMSLLGAGDSSQTMTATAPFMLPAPVQYEAGITGGTPRQVAPVSYGDSGQPRAQATSPSPQVNIQVNAMDSQSFLDHSDEIARAVRAALLNSNSLSDVISDL